MASLWFACPAAVSATLSLVVVAVWSQARTKLSLSLLLPVAVASLLVVGVWLVDRVARWFDVRARPSCRRLSPKARAEFVVELEREIGLLVDRHRELTVAVACGASGELLVEHEQLSARLAELSRRAVLYSQ